MELGIAKKPVDKLKCNSKKTQLSPKRARKRKKEMTNRLDKLKTNKN